jgi:hypothetical protein
MRFFVTARELPRQQGGGDEMFYVDFLVRLPRHLARLDESQLDHAVTAKAWWTSSPDGTTETSRINQPLAGVTVLRAEDVVYHPERARSCDGIWIRLAFKVAVDLTASAAASGSRRLFAALSLHNIVVPRLPVEAYPPDLNRLVALPPALVTISSNGHKLSSVADAIDSSIDGKARHPFPLPFIRSENVVSLYQPGPDRAVPFVVLAFAALPFSVLLIRLVAAVAK